MQRILVYRDKLVDVSRLNVGVTITQVSPAETWAGTIEARDRASAHVAQMPNAVYNIHTTGFGVTPEIVDSTWTTWNWKDLDRRMKWLKDRGVKNIMLTFYGAPAWMTELGLHPTYLRLKPEHNKKFGELCVEILKRYTSAPWDMPIKYVQFWNEMKGWGKAGVGWDYDGYTKAYNAFYETMRSYPQYDKIKIGGPYIVLSDYGVPAIDYTTLHHWYYNAKGGDAICMSYSLTGLLHQPFTKEEYMMKTYQFATLAEYFRYVYKGLEYWASENYWWSDLSRFDGLDVDFQGACTASILYHELIKGCHISLFWGLQGDGRFADDGVQGSWLVDTRGAWGGKTTSRFLAGDKTPVYNAFKIFHDHFPPGTKYYHVETSDDMIECLVSDTITLVINKYDIPVEVSINGYRTILNRYEFKTFSNSVIGL